MCFCRLLSAGGDKELHSEIAKGLKEAKTKLKAAKRKDYYKILDVSKDADEDGLKKAYRRMAVKWHPDKHATDEEEEKKKAEATFKVRIEVKND
jgi:DnaJ family protein C protein 7